MKNNVMTRLLVTGLLCLALAVVALGLVATPPVSEAAPPAAPTPIGNVLQTDQARYFPFQTQTALAADTNTAWRDVGEFDSLDVQYVIDQGTVNTATLTIQYSIDGTNAVNGLALVTSNAADASDITRVPVFGRYMRVNQSLANTNTITVTLVAVGR